MRLGYYPGCVSRSTGKEMDLSTRAVAGALGIELEELEDWSCCGATHVPNDLISVALAARNMAQTSLPIMTACSICYSNLRHAVQRMEEPGLKTKVNSVLTRPYDGVCVRHVLEVLLEALEKERDRIVIPLKDLKVAPYYGCLLTRPRGGIDSPEFPTILEKLIKALKAEPVQFRLKTLCCGGPIFMPRGEAAGEIAFRILKDARGSGAEVVVTVCPLCHLMLDAKQRSLEMHYGEEIGMPVLYVTQLAGIALGLKPEDLGLSLNAVSPLPLVRDRFTSMSQASSRKEGIP
jgi:heterodisulfide reductase subunit B